MYFLFEINNLEEPLPYRTRYEPKEFKMKASKWLSGRLMELEGKSVEIELWKRHGDALSEIFLDTIPLFSEEVVEVMRSSGVDNLEICPARLVYPSREHKVSENYFAVNILEPIECADMDRSQYIDKTGTGSMLLGFQKLIIDEKKTNGALFFRLAESLSSIIIHEKVKNRLEKQKYRYIRFIPLFE